MNVSVPIPSVSTLSLLIVDIPATVETLDVIKFGSLSSLIIPVVIFAPSESLVASDAIPVRLPIIDGAVRVPVTSASVSVENPETTRLFVLVRPVIVAPLFVNTARLAY